MQYMPTVESMDRLDGGPLGDAHAGILFGNIKAIGEIEYAYLFVVYDLATRQPVLIVSSEKNTMQKRFGGGSHFLGLFDGTGHANLGDSNDWAVQEKFFQKALQVVDKQMNIRPER